MHIVPIIECQYVSGTNSFTLINTFGAHNPVSYIRIFLAAGNRKKEKKNKPQTGLNKKKIDFLTNLKVQIFQSWLNPGSQLYLQTNVFCHFPYVSWI